MRREHNDTMLATFVGVRDGYLAARMGGRALWPGGLPHYAQPETAPRTGEDLFSDWAHLVKPRGDN